ncbi:MAG: TldD/PmbA family protein [Oscillatoria sp. SIO1A7]|nr:TldD/PmbA family protein [Oscillatoria sp. SIO1A7]
MVSAVHSEEELPREEFVEPEKLLELAKQSGAEAAEVLKSQSRSRPVFFEANRLKELQSAESEGTALRVWRNGRPGIAVAYGAAAPQALVERALALSELNEPETIELAGASRTSYPDVGEAVGVEQLVLWGKEAIASIRDRYPELLCAVELDCETETTRLVNSQGLDCSYQDTTLSFYISAEWVRSDDFLMVSDGQMQRGYLEPQIVAKQILQRLDWAKENIEPPTGRVPILFTAKAADMLWGTLQAALNGKRVLEGASPWSDRSGQKVTSSAITISQQPHIGPFSCPFDDEGTPTQEIVFIQDGVLQQFYSSRATARSLGTPPTGNGFRPSLGSYPAPGLYNWLIQPGSRSLLELIASLENGIVVDQMLGGGAGISGDFSINLDLAYRVLDGEIVGRVKDTMVAGNAYSALKQLVELGGDAEWNGSCYSPSLIVEGLSVTGKEQ